VLKVTSKFVRRFLSGCLLLFITLNVVAILHAYRFTHFGSNSVEKTQSAEQLSTLDKLKVLFTGVNNPRPRNVERPAKPYETVSIVGNKTIECWYIRVNDSKGTVMLFHGFGGEKSGLLNKSDEFLKLGYNTLLVDFMGSGGSEGNQTTIGFFEADQVKSCYDYLETQGEKNILLFGTSMGAVAILKAIDSFGIAPKSIIIECPFGTMYETVCARFRMMNVPTFPMAGLLVFWGGVENGYWAFAHNPREYAKGVKCPVLLMYGEMDEKVSRHEIDDIFDNLGTQRKVLRLYPQAGHENYLTRYKEDWTSDVSDFLKTQD